MRININLFGFLILSLTAFAQQPVVTTRPRVLLTAAFKEELVAKKNANHPLWVALKADADKFSSWPVISPYSNPDNQIYRDDVINYYYQGSRWVEVAIPLALAYQLTGDTRYSNKLKELADVIIGGGDAPMRVGSGYPSRNIGRTVAIIYDWCYNALSAAQRSGLVDVMKRYYAFMRFDDPDGGAYQNYENATGNYYWGHPDAAAFMGYAMSGDDALGGDAGITSAEMIAWARYRFDGTVIEGLPAKYRSFDFVKQTFEGGYPTLAGRTTHLAADRGNPHRGGIHVQGWSYGSDVFSQYIDYVQLVKTATGEDLISPNSTWWQTMLLAQKHSLLPNGYHADEAGDNGTNLKNRIREALPLRLAYILAGTPWAGRAMHFLKEELRKGSAWDEAPAEAESWERFYFASSQSPSAFECSPYYSGFDNGVNLEHGNGAMPYFLMRDRWGVQGTWISFQASAATIDDHDHFNAGNIDINFRGEYIVSSPSQSNYAEHSGASNTLFFDDRGDYQAKDDRRVGGQSAFGRNQVAAAIQTDSFSYVRAVLTTAYNRTADHTANPPASRKLNYFIRNFLYLRPANLVIVYDQVGVKSQVSGAPYNSHIRWHFADGAAKPAASGNRIKASTKNAVINIHTVMPESASIAIVDQSANPDGVPFHAKYYFNTDTWRAEVHAAAAASDINYLSVLQPGPPDLIEMETRPLASADGSMMGVYIESKAGARRDLAFFNASHEAAHAPLSSLSLPVKGKGTLYYTLAGVTPQAKYRTTVSADGQTVVVDAHPDGTLSADIAGVLHFALNGSNPGDPRPVTAIEEDLFADLEIFPNPSAGYFSVRSGQDIQNMCVFDLGGRQIESHYAGGVLRLEAAAGIYLLRIRMPKGITTRKLMIKNADQ